MRKWAVVSPTSPGVRIAPAEQGSRNLFSLQATSAESNALSIPASLGLPVLALARFEKNDPISEFIRREMRGRGIECAEVQTEKGNPWGDRHPCNIADRGFGLRGPRVANDRAGELGRELCAGDFDLDRIFEKEGAEILHLSGLVCSLSARSARCGLDLAVRAKANGALVSFDTNYRPSLWKGRESELLAAFDAIARHADILFGGDILAEKMEGAEPFFGRLAADADELVENAKFFTKKARENYPAEVCISTMRTTPSANRHTFGAVALTDWGYTALPPADIPVYDRIGGGDAFVGGFLYGTVKGWEMRERLLFGRNCAAFVSGLADDYGLPASEEQIWNMRSENGRADM